MSSAPGRRPAKRMSPTAAPNSVEDADHGEEAEEPEHERLGPRRLHQREADRRPDQPAGNHDQPADAADPSRTIDGRIVARRLPDTVAHAGLGLSLGCGRRGGESPPRPTE